VIRIIILGIFLLVSANSREQSVPGQWTAHLPFSNAVEIIHVEPIVYCGTQSGLFEYNTESFLIKEWSKVDGLSGVSIKTMAYSPTHKTLILAYSDSNIDLIIDQSQIINIPDIKSKQMTGSKTINSITVYNDQAYLSCGFGIIVINLIKGEIATTYYIGDEGEQLEVFETGILKTDSLIAATAKGIRKAHINNPNLENYRMWDQVVGLPALNGTFHQLAYDQDNIYVAKKSLENAGDSVFIYDGNQWRAYSWVFKNIIEMSLVKGNLLTVSDFQINMTGVNQNELWNLNDYGFDYLRASDAILDNQGILWIADNMYGLLKTSDRLTFEKIRPDGPWDRKAFDLSVSDGELWVAAGGYDGAWNNLWNFSGVSFTSNKQWNVYNPKTSPLLEEVRDIVRVVPNPYNSSQVFAASWGYGILEFQNGELLQIYNDQNTNGALASIIPDKPYIRIGGMAFDSQSNLWVSNSSVPNPISVKTPDGKWKSFPYGVFLGEAFAGEIVITKNNSAYDEVKWVQLPKGNGLFAFYTGKDLEDNSDDTYQVVTVRALWPQNNIKVVNDIHSMAVDLNNELWLGTSAGVTVYHAPNQVFYDYPGRFYSSQPSVDEGDGYYHALLETEIVSAIAVDGANRKWFGTKNSGVFLTNPEGTEIIRSFNVLNSPLLSNNILSIAIDQQNGEVYFGTEAGIVSYRSDAIADSESDQPIYAFPNPVRPDYEGPITVRGIASNSIVKITDINGNLVYQTESLGGQAVWNGKDLQGQKVQSGVYMVFSSTELAERKSVAKILVIR
jgi:hypothetical protein